MNRLVELSRAVRALDRQTPRFERWGALLAERLGAGARLLAAGNGGSAAEAQHLTAELVGRFDREREPFAAVALHADTSSLTAIGNDYGFADVYARQVTAHARPKDVLVLLSTSGRSENVLRAAAAGRARGATVLALTGPLPNPLAELADDTLAVDGGTSTVQEAHLISVHLMCEAFEAAIADSADDTADDTGETVPDDDARRAS
ncbi:D-sedoheptulose-7-phosphate isomerase [Actinophytocola gossypii]|uniref:SIS domain-containing protein n=1 Tax=Actinophytocola gossypii TaxID=2812003 RepID=A0ABT2J6T5_9PSEU|nr:SIS domain-containing protein [Actinophytocola gossypii]MCT2583486.1 SIS domain-containing protein [Actinophytocola gossypii]